VKRRQRKINKRAKWHSPIPPLKLQVAYYKDLMEYTQNVANIFESEIFPILRTGTFFAQDAEKSALDLAFMQFMKRVSGINRSKIESGIYKMVEGVEVFQRSVFVANIKALAGVDVSVVVSQKQVADGIKDALKVNYDLVSSIGPSYADRGRAIIENALNTGKARKDIEKELLALGGFKEQYAGTEQRRAKTIARDQSQKFSKSIDTLRQKKLGIRHFTWMDSKDSRVRKTHALWGGHRFSYADPPNGKLPGDEVDCRCYAKPDVEELLVALEKGEMAA
jgi:SPP1 gp7 family putative phage head morphogenesis protein